MRMWGHSTVPRFYKFYHHRSTPIAIDDYEIRTIQYLVRLYLLSAADSFPLSLRCVLVEDLRFGVPHSVMTQINEWQSAKLDYLVPLHVRHIFCLRTHDQFKTTVS